MSFLVVKEEAQLLGPILQGALLQPSQKEISVRLLLFSFLSYL